MSKATKILFVCSEPNYNIFNRRSAIDSILCSILEELNDDYSIMVNNQPFERPTAQSESTPINNGFKTKIKSLVPKAIKERLKMKRLLKLSERLKDDICKTNFQPDLIIELYKLGSTLGYDLKKHFACPLLVYYDSPVVEQYEDIWKIKAPYKSELIRRQSKTIQCADSIIAYSNPVKEYLHKMGAVGEVHIFQTLDYSRLTHQEKCTDSQINVGFIGSFMPWHRVDMLVKAFDEIVLNVDVPCCLHLIGYGECFESIKSQVAQIASKEKIILHGFLDGDDLKKIKATLDIGVMPGSNWYGIPTKVYEYGAAGIASIAPDTPTISDIFTNEKDILLFKWENYDDFKRNLQKLIQDQSLRQSIVKGLRVKIDGEHTLQVARNNYNKWISDLI